MLVAAVAAAAALPLLQAANFSQCVSDGSESQMYIGLNMPIPTATTVAPVVQPTTDAAITTTMTPAGVVFYDWLIAVVAGCAAVALVCAVVLVALKRKKKKKRGEEAFVDYR